MKLRSTSIRFARALIMMTSDTLALASAWTIAYFLWPFLIRGQTALVYFKLWVFIPVFLLSYAFGGLYPGFGIGAVETLRRLTLRTSFIFIAMASTSFVFRVPHHYARMGYVIAFLMSLFLVTLFRFILLAGARRMRWWREPVVIIGTGQIVRQAVLSLREAFTLGYAPQGIFVEESENDLPPTIEGVPVLGDLEALQSVDLVGIRTVLVAEGDKRLSNDDFDALHEVFRHVVLLRAVGDIPVEGVEIRNLGGILGIEFQNQLLVPMNRFLKRAIDIIFSFIALLFLSPIILLCAGAVKIFSSGPAFYGQVRGGLEGREITIWKLRTMYRDAEERLKEYLRSNDEARIAWETRFKLENDPRVIPVVGRLFRRFSLDELPQFWQVLMGEMSLVGPRPYPGYHLEKLSRQAKDLRARVRPGITGLWQVMARGEGGVEEQELFDTHYIKNWSLWMDLYILARTAIVVVLGKGAH